MIGTAWSHLAALPAVCSKLLASTSGRDKESPQAGAALSRPDRPLICYRVDQVAKLRHTDTNETPAVHVLTDRNGELEIHVDPLNPTFWLYVYSGSSLFVRFPCTRFTADGHNQTFRMIGFDLA